MTLALPSSAAAGAVYLVLLALGLLVAWAVSARFWPWGACRRCGGGRLRSPTGRYWRDCPRCGGSGQSARIGSRRG